MQVDREASEQRRYNIEILLQRYDCRERAKLLNKTTDFTESTITSLIEDLIVEFSLFKEMELRGRKNDLEKIVAGHLHYYRPFEMKPIVKEGEFINKDGIYMLFEGYCGIYRKSARVAELTPEE